MAAPDGPRASGRGYETPTTSEMTARHAAVRAMLERSGFDALLVYGNLVTGHPIRYLTAWPPGWDSYVIFPGEGRPQLLVPSENHVPTAEAMAGEAVDVRYVGHDPVVAITEAIGSHGGGSGRHRIGVVGPLPYQRHLAIAALPDLELVDADGAFRELRMIKSADEIARTRRAAHLADVAVEALIAEARPGMPDFELGAIVQGAYRRLGGEDGICFLATASTRTGGALVPAQVWSDRRLAGGDVIMLELSVGVGGDTSQVLRTISVGEPSAATLRLHEVADRAFRSIVGAIGPGAPVSAVLAAASIIDDAGLGVVDDVVHGYGGGYLPPVLRTPRTQRHPPADRTLKPGMMLVVQPNVVDRERSLGVQTGELVVVTEEGRDRFHALPLGLLGTSVA